jgi:hypothetical protein
MQSRERFLDKLKAILPGDFCCNNIKLATLVCLVYFSEGGRKEKRSQFRSFLNFRMTDFEIVLLG